MKKRYAFFLPFVLLLAISVMSAQQTPAPVSQVKEDQLY